MSFERDIVIMGGCGHAGLPLGMAFANHGADVTLFDSSAEAVERVNAGIMPFREIGADELLPKLLACHSLRATTDPRTMGTAENAVVVVGTPVDRYLSPDIGSVPRAIGQVAEHLVDGQLLVLRSTIYPGVTKLVERFLTEQGRDPHSRS